MLIYSFHFGIYICILSRSCHTKVFLKTVFLKIPQYLQENTCTGASFLSATSNFINEETPAQCFPKPLTTFAKSPIVNSYWVLNTPITSLLKHRECQRNDLQSLFSVKLSENSKIVTVLYQHDKSTIQRDKPLGGSKVDSALHPSEVDK